MNKVLLLVFVIVVGSFSGDVFAEMSVKEWLDEREKFYYEVVVPGDEKRVEGLTTQLHLFTRSINRPLLEEKLAVTGLVGRKRMLMSRLMKKIHHSYLVGERERYAGCAGDRYNTGYLKKSYSIMRLASKELKKDWYKGKYIVLVFHTCRVDQEKVAVVYEGEMNRGGWYRYIKDAMAVDRLYGISWDIHKDNGEFRSKVKPLTIDKGTTMLMDLHEVLFLE